MIDTCNTEHTRGTLRALRDLKGEKMAAPKEKKSVHSIAYANRRNRFNAKKRRSLSVFLPTDVLQELDIEKIRQSFANRDDLITAILEERYFGESREQPLEPAVIQ